MQVVTCFQGLEIWVEISKEKKNVKTADKFQFFYLSCANSIFSMFQTQIMYQGRLGVSFIQSQKKDLQN